MTVGAAENRALERAHWALRCLRICPFAGEEPFAAIIRCTTDPAKVDKRTRSKWSRVLRYALAKKRFSEPLDQFIKRNGGSTNALTGLQLPWPARGQMKCRVGPI
jgi:hypothetical protein